MEKCLIVALYNCKVKILVLKYLMSASTHTFPQQLFARPISLSLAWCLTKEQNV